MSLDARRPPVADWRGSGRDWRDLIVNGVRLRTPEGNTQLIAGDVESFDRAVMDAAMAWREAANHAGDVRVIITRRNDRTETTIDACSAGWAAIRAAWRLGLVNARARRKLERATVDPTYLTNGQTKTEVPPPMSDPDLAGITSAPRPGPAAGIAPAA